MKKNWYVLLVLAIAMLLMAACGSNDEGSEDDSADASAASGPVEIEFWYGLGSEADKKMQEIVQNFNNSQEDVVVTPVPQADYSETYQKLQASIASGSAPGVFITGLGTLNDLVSKEAIAPLDEFTAEDEIYDEADFLEVFIEPAKMNDSLYALPAYGTTQVMYYRKDILEEAGIDPEEAYATWENVATTSKELQEKGLVQYGHLPMWGADNLIDIATSNGGSVLSEDGKEVLIDSPEWIEAWEFVRKQIHEEESMKVNSGGQGWEYWYKTIDEVMNGTALGYTGSSGDKGDLDFSIIDSAPQPGLNGNEGRPNVDALYMAIPEIISDEEKAAGYAFMSYFSSAETSAEWSQAIGYIPVRNSAMEVPEYAQFIEENPYAAVPYEQAQTGIPYFVDPTGGKIRDAISIAADKVELQNVPAEEALKEAKETAQAALDEM
ncbi:ABC transporter substrate-binding protein [Oceanobacillus zhaokaii]|uniref:ABC transporter substrate-binding protein n=1 Tax=Oceanobacillus zhaokaii TaxID=2052660 RepID=A0A345PJW6_9BACI|nr:ABC transporter substrate-binding protein [Oceanobacillus zhaokaii]AXI10296.1 ABC transporter substrate-binding protein [Oceanobacillus zhaokaii]